MSDHFHDNWTRIDESEDPDFFLAALDASRMSMLRAAEQDPDSYFAWLDLRPGMRVLEVGCGPGGLTQILARLVGVSGRAVGLDLSAYMIGEARRRAADGRLPIEFITGDAQALPFDHDSFDRVLANTTFQHLRDPARALAQAVRVTRPGGLVAVTDQDWETLVVDGADVSLCRQLTLAFAHAIRHGRLGRRLPGLFHSAGLLDISVTPETAIYRNFAVTRSFMWDQVALIGRERGAADAARIDAWLGDLARRDEDGTFFAACTAFRVTGRVPAVPYDGE
jgi:SAM-dependent methyltransferase